MQAAFLAYLIGVTVGLWRTDGTVPVRFGLALLWPVGPAAFVATIALLLAASLIAFPVVGVLTAGAAGLLWWILSA